MIPDDPDQPGVDNDLTFGGTYAVSGQTVTFDHDADTFVRDAAWIYDGDLRTEQNGIVAVLEKVSD